MNQIRNLLQVGAQFELSGSPFEVINVKSDEIRMAPMNGGPMRHLKFKALDALMAASQIIITFLPRDLEEKFSQGIRAMTEKQIQSMNRRKHYVEGMMLAAPDSCCSKKVIAKFIPELAESLGDDKPPKPSAVASWIKKWRTSGHETQVLANASKPSRRDWLDLNPEAAQFVHKAIQDIYLSTQRYNKEAVYTETLRLIANHNCVTKSALPFPSRHVVNKAIKAVDRYERDYKRHGKDYANKRNRATARMLCASRPLEICMADGQFMDILVVSAPIDGSPPEILGRPYLTAIMDVRTRCILSAFVSLQPFSGGTVLKAMQDAIVATPGCPKGVMETLIVDNGCDFRDSGFIKFLNALDVNLEICGPRSPNGKAHVERFFRTLNEGLIHRLPGTTFSNPEHRGSYRSQDLAVLPLKELNDHVQTWIHEVYHVRPHAALGRAPIDVWNEETSQ